MSADREILNLLDQQCCDYRDMYEVGRRQRSCIESDDLTGLEEAFAQMHQLMDQVRLRQAKLPRAPGGVREIEDRFALMRDWLERLQEQRLSTQRMAEELLKRNRDEYQQFGRGRRAVRGYQNSRPQEASRLYDGMR